MSIVGPLLAAPVLTPTTLPTTSPGEHAPDSAALLTFGVGFIAFSLLVAWAAGVFRRRSIAGPERIPRPGPIVPLLLVTLLGATAWLLGQSAVVMRVMSKHPGQPLREELFTATDLAAMSVAPAVAGLVVLLLGDRAARLVAGIGYNLGRVPGGLWRGVVAAVIALPLVNGVGNLLVLLYQWIGFQHPNEHQLLGAMKEASPLVQRLLVAGACVAAPVFEEMLFRGHLQTLLVRLFSSRTLPESPLALAGVPDPVIQPVPGAPAPRRYLWAAVLVTSLLFALVHPGWMRPMIFVLSLCLGYAYERTGNLWVPIVLHAAFNTASTALFLNTM